jgi:hypothetical protein
VSLSIVCAYCAKPLLDANHARAHGPTCERNPTRAAVRRQTLTETAELAESVAKEPGLTGEAQAALLGFAAALRKSLTPEPAHG